MSDLIYGRRPVWELLKSGRRDISVLLVSEGAHGREMDSLVRHAESRGVRVRRVKRDELERRARGQVHQGVAAEVSEFRYADLDDLLARVKAGGERTRLVALDELTDPQNLGAILRSARAFGAAGAIVEARRSSPVTPVAIKASAGAAEHLPVARVGNLVAALEKLKKAGFWVVGADPASSPLDAAFWERPVVLVIGSEGKGMRRLVRETCDALAGIPLAQGAGSLNASCAAAVLLYEAARRPAPA